MRTSWAVVLVGLVGFVNPGCRPEQGAVERSSSAGNDQQVQGGPSLVLVSSREDGLVRVGLEYRASAHATRPRAAEVFLLVSSSLRYVDAQAGPSAVAAGKQLVVQPKEGAVLRTVLFSSTNLETMGPGRLLTWTFEAVGSGPARLELVDTGNPALAPAGANEGLELGDPLVVSLD